MASIKPEVLSEMLLQLRFAAGNIFQERSFEFSEQHHGSRNNRINLNCFQPSLINAGYEE
jgi:hypothetical protein